MADYTVTWVILGVYLVVLVCILIHTQLQKRLAAAQGGLGEHYLASRKLPGVFLSLTTIASMFSGYTVTGLPAEAYSSGYSFLRWIGLNIPMLVTLLALAPRLAWLAQVRGYVSALDVVRDRFVKGPIFPCAGFDAAGSALHWLSTLTFLVPSAIYLLAQFISFSANMHTLAGGTVPEWAFGLAFFVILVVFEVAGGLKAVVLTDVFQGGILLFGAAAWLAIQGPLFGSLEEATAKLAKEDLSLVAPPSGQGLENWFNFMIWGASRIVFPDIVTRISAAGSQRPMRGTAVTFVVSILLIFMAMGLMGIHGRARFGPDVAPNSVFTMVCLEVVESGWAGAVIGSLLIASSTAAIMSTADSVLMEVAKLVSLDVCKPLLQACGKTMDDGATLQVGRVMTFLVAGLCWALTASSALTMENLSTLLGLQALFNLAMVPTFFASMYSDSTPAWLCAASIAFGLVGGVSAWALKLNPETTVGEPMPILTSIVLLVNFFLVAVVTLARRWMRSPDQLWEQWSKIIADRDARQTPSPGDLRRPPLPRPSLARPSVLAPVREPIHCWPVLLGVMAALPLLLPWGGADLAARTFGMPDWSVIFLGRVAGLVAVLLYLVVFSWGESPKEGEEVVPADAGPGLAGASATTHSESA